jgi:hypothetical protein
VLCSTHCPLRLSVAKLLSLRVCCVRAQRARAPTMAWRSHGSDNASLVQELERNGIVKSPRVKAAMMAVDRGLFSADKDQVNPEPPTHGGAQLRGTGPLT